jgi:hypothetical protein
MTAAERLRARRQARRARLLNVVRWIDDKAREDERYVVSILTVGRAEHHRFRTVGERNTFYVTAREQMDSVTA